MKSLLTFFFFVGIFFFFLFPLGGDGDFWHHLNTGKYVSENLSLPKVDEFTFTATGRPWVGYAWGAGVILYQTYHLFGAIGINTLVALIAVITFGLLYYYITRLGVSWKITLFSLTLAAFPITTRWPARPEIFSYPLLISILIVDILRKEKPKAVYLYPLIILVWANIYGSSVIVGIGLVIFLFVKQFMEEKTYSWPSLLSIPLAFANGYGTKTVFYLWLIPQITHQQTEWGGIFKGLGGSMDYLISFQYWLLLYLLYLVVFCIALFLSPKSIKTKPFLFLTSLSIFVPIFIFRQVALGAILAAPFLAILIDDIALSKQKILIAIGGIVILFGIPLSLWVDKRGWGRDLDPFSPHLIEFIKNNNLEGAVFNNQQIGAFLTYHLYPKVQVFTDTRDDLYIGTPTLTDFGATFGTGDSIIPLVEKYKPDFIVGDLAEGPSYKPLFYSEDWAIVYLKGTYFIAIPKNVADSKKLPQLSAVDPFTFTGAKDGQEELALSEYEKIGTSQEDFWNGRMRLALLYLGLNQYDAAIDTLSTLYPQKNPKGMLFQSDLDYTLTQAYFAKENCEYTKKYLDKTKADISNKFIFNPGLQIPSLIDKGYTFYYLMCESDERKASIHLQIYLSNSSLSPEEINSTQKQYDQIISQ